VISQTTVLVKGRFKFRWCLWSCDSYWVLYCPVTGFINATQRCFLSFYVLYF